MKILIVNRFFGGAQIPTGRMAEDVALKLVEAGHEVTALASSGEYVGAARRADGIQHTVSGIREGIEPRSQGTGDRRQLGALRVDTVRVPTWMPRALAWLWFTLQARKRIPQMEWDVCALMTDPPLLPLLAAKAAMAGVSVTRCFSEVETADEPINRNTDLPKHRAKRRVAVWLMDLYPEALAASGRITKSNPLYRWYFNKRQRTLGAADLLICLGQTQKKRLETKRRKDEKSESGRHTANGIQQTRIAVVPPWDDRGNIDLATERSLKNLALYAGNLGEAHCFEEILAAAPYLPADWTIRFAARGAKLAALLSKLRSDEWRVTGDESGSAYAESDLKLTDLKLKTAGAVVHVSGYASEEETPKLLASARVHLITMSPGWEGIVVPSKLYGCIRTGRPVLFIGPQNADTAREICAHDWGKVLPPGVSGKEVALAILELAARPTRDVGRRSGAKETAALLEALAAAQGPEFSE